MTRDQLEDEQGQSWLEAEDGCSDAEGSTSGRKHVWSSKGLAARSGGAQDRCPKVFLSAQEPASLARGHSFGLGRQCLRASLMLTSAEAGSGSTWE